MPAREPATAMALGGVTAARLSSGEGAKADEARAAGMGTGEAIAMRPGCRYAAGIWLGISSRAGTGCIGSAKEVCGVGTCAPKRHTNKSMG